MVSTTIPGLTLSAIDSGNGINYVTSATYGPDSGLTGSQTVFSIGYDFHVGNGTSGADNGDVWGITNYKDTTRNQTFAYDPLNRLISAQNAGTDCTVNVLTGNKKFWGNTYGYDAWGNLINKTKIGTACAGENLAVTADAHNWIHATGGSDYLYDAAGNMTLMPRRPRRLTPMTRKTVLTAPPVMPTPTTATATASANQIAAPERSTGI